ncbi:MAG: Nucleotidyl transferase [Candidatus Peribacteria bacterium GW2011_GWC2_54_8]|nr:MAG: Nucleotidyl transferase [Candidatus Peribacteria bacterium GW2011_GWC2_54_8]
MKTLLLLAGRSTRFWPLTEKSLFPLCGKTLLEHQISRLHAAGCRDIVLVGGAHNLEEVRSSFPGLPVIEQENLELGMRGALLSALPTIKNEPVMLVSGNDVIHPSGYASLQKRAKGVAGALLAQKVNQYFPGGYLELDGDRIVSIIEKPGEGNEPGNLVNIVAHVHNNASTLLKALGNVNEERDDGYEQALQKLFGTGEYRAAPYEGVWQAVKYPWHLLSLLPIFFSDFKKPIIHRSVFIHPTAVIDGPVVIEEGARVMPHSTIRGPCFVGRHSIIANNALVRDSSVGENCVIGYNTEIKGSILHSHVWTHMSYIGDSVIGRNVSFGGGTITANFGLDEQGISSAVQGEELQTGLTKFGAVIGSNCRLGIQVGISPGVKIGSGTFISSGTQIAEDISDGKYARMKEGTLKVSDNRTNAPDPAERERYRTKVEG